MLSARVTPRLCRRPVVNLASRMDEGFVDGTTPLKFVVTLYVVTAAVQASASAGYDAGSSVYSLDPTTLQFARIASLPCCGAIWRSAVYAGSTGMSRNRYIGAGTPAKTPTASKTASQSPTASMSRSWSASATVSPSFSQTPRPFHVQLVPAGASAGMAAATATVSPSQAVCGGPAGSVCVSKALPPARFVLAGSGCPAPQASLRCAAQAGSGIIVVPAVQTIACSVPGTVDALLPASVQAIVDPLVSAASQARWATQGSGTTMLPGSGIVSEEAAAAPVTVRIDCELTAGVDAAGAPRSAPADATVSVFPHEWPLPLSDMLLYFPDAKAVVSTRFRTQVAFPSNTSTGSTAGGAGLASSACGSVAAPGNNSSSSNAPACLGPSEGKRIAELLVLSRLRAGAAGEDFSATVAGRATALLIAPWRNGSLVPVFAPPSAAASAGNGSGTHVFVGGQAAPVLWVNANGTMAEVALPLLCTSASTSGASATGCGRQSLTITSRLAAPSALQHELTAVNMSCPPFCPGAFEGAFPFLGLAAANGASADSTTPQLARWPVGAAAASDLPEVVQWSGSALGLVYAFACPGYTSPHLDSACTNASHPLFANCAFGEGAACRRCPANAICPGGSRMWPSRPGFFVEAESTGVLLRCAPPSTTRCIEFDVAAGAMRCGEAYAQGSWGCLTCAAGSYPQSDGGCAPCPKGQGYALLARELGKALGILFAWAIAVYALLYGIAKALGSSLRGSAMRLLDLLLFAWVLLQTIAAVGTEATTGLPAALQALYAAISALQLRGLSVPAACLIGDGISPFASEIAAFAFVLLALPAVLLLATGSGDRAMQALAEKWRKCCAAGICARCCAGQASAGGKGAPSSSSVDGGGSTRNLTQPKGAWAKLQARTRAALARFPLGYALCFALVVLYAYVCKASLALLACQSATLPLGQAAGLQGADAAALTAAANSQGLVTVSIVSAHPSFLCGAGAHAVPYALAWLVLIFFVITFPIVSWLWAWRCKRRATLARRGAALNPVAAFLLTATYRPGAFFVRQLDMVQLAVLSALSTLWLSPASAGALAGRCTLQCLVLLAMSVTLVRVRPYTMEDAWRLPLRVASLCLGGLVAVVGALTGAANLAEADADAAGRASLLNALQGLAWTLFACAILYVLLLIAAVGRSLITGARAEATIEHLRRKAATAAASAGQRARSAITSLSRSSSGGGSSSGDGASNAVDAPAGASAGAGADDCAFNDEDDEPLSDWHVGGARGFVASVSSGWRDAGGLGGRGRSVHHPRPFFAQLELAGAGSGSAGGTMSRDAMKALAVYGDPSASGAAASDSAGPDGSISVPLALRRDLASHAAAESDIASAAASAGGRGAAFFTVSNPLSAPGVSQAVSDGANLSIGSNGSGGGAMGAPVGVGVDEFTPPRFTVPPPPSSVRSNSSSAGDGDRIRVLPTMSRKKPLSSG